MLLDIALGIFTAVGVGWMMEMDVTGWMVVFGIIVALLPDADFVWHVLRSKKNHAWDHEHRELLHVPLVYIPFGTVITFFALGGVWTVIFAVASLTHFLHDSIGIGWGVQWLRPFSKRSYKFFAQKDGSFSWQYLVAAWSLAELHHVADQHGNSDWIKDIYLHPSPTLIIEVIGLIVAMVIVWQLIVQ
jgi:hypothetical protein